MALSEINQEITENIKLIYQEHGEAITAAIKAALTQNNKVATGKLLRSVEFRIKDNTKVVTLEILGDEVLKLAGGRLPGKMPPVQEILRWIRVKGIQSHGITSKTVIRKGQSVIRRRNVKASEKRFAYAVAKSIMKKGSKSLQLVEPLIQSEATEINKNIGDILTKVYSDSLSDVLGKDGNVLNLSYSIYGA